MPAALALARVLRLTPREALALLGQARVLPAELDPVTAEGACRALRALGVEASTVEVPPGTSRCPTHPSLTGEGPCEECRTLVCPLCLPRCGRCTARLAAAARWKRLRVGVLVALLLGLVAWGALRQRGLDRRTAWHRPLQVSVVLVGAQPVEEPERAAWSAGLGALDEWFAGEAVRLGLKLERPLHFELAPTTVLAEPPRPPQGSGEWLRDSQAALALRSTLKSLAARGQAPGAVDVQLLVALRPGGAGVHSVEGIGEAGGAIGLVEGTSGDTALTLELVAVAHELLHCLGARDGYDAQGHALPRGLVEPEEGLPQRFAEVMVGEVPLGPSQGRIPSSLQEVRIGEETAREVGWLPEPSP